MSIFQRKKITLHLNLFNSANQRDTCSVTFSLILWQHILHRLVCCYPDNGNPTHGGLIIDCPTLSPMLSQPLSLAALCCCWCWCRCFTTGERSRTTWEPRTLNCGETTILGIWGLGNVRVCQEKQIQIQADRGSGEWLGIWTQTKSWN